MLIQIDSYESILHESFEDIVDEINGLYYLMDKNVKNIPYEDVEKEKMHLEIKLIHEIASIKNSLKYLQILMTDYEDIYELYRNKELED